MDQPEPREKPARPSVFKMLAGNVGNIFGIMACYFLGLTLGYGWPDTVNPVFLENLDKTQQAMMNEFQGEHIQYVLAHFGNLFFMLYIVMMSSVLFCVPPVLFILFESILAGVVCAQNGWGLHALFIPSLPDALELAAVFVSMGFGMKIGFSLFKTPRFKNLKDSVFEAHRVFVTVVFILLVAASGARLMLMSAH